MKKKRIKTKKKKRTGTLYKCELCGGIEPYLFAFCACDKCETMLRKHIKHYRKYRESIEKKET